jgi:hypothetical protein
VCSYLRLYINLFRTRLSAVNLHLAGDDFTLRAHSLRPYINLFETGYLCSTVIFGKNRSKQMKNEVGGTLAGGESSCEARLERSRSGGKSVMALHLLYLLSLLFALLRW